MADLTADAPLRFWGEAHTESWVLDNSAAQTIYKGQPMIMDLSEDTVYPRGFVDATDTEINNSIDIYVYPTIIGFKSTVFTDADVGDTVYMSDSATLSATAADNPMLGKLHRVRDGFAYVQLSTPTICTGA